MYVYKTTNLLTGRRYIGSCTRPINKSKWYYGSNGQLKKDIKEFGKENFVKEILWQTEDFDELQEMELKIIKQVNACNDDAWYNKYEHYGICRYGQPGTRLGAVTPEETKKKLGEAWTYSEDRVDKSRAALKTPESRAKRSKAQKARMTKEARQNLSDKQTGKIRVPAKTPGVSSFTSTRYPHTYWRAQHGKKYLGCSKDYDTAVKLKQDYLNQLKKGAK
jgi:hypothetical protein